MQVRSKKKADAETQRREEKAAREQAKREKEARSYTNVMQVPILHLRLILWAKAHARLRMALVFFIFPKCDAT